MSEEPAIETEHEVSVIDHSKSSHKRKGFFSKFDKNQIRVMVVALFVLVGGAFVFAKAATTSYSLWPNNPIPSTISSYRSSSVELGVKFKSRNSGYITGIRFYKGAQNTGTHVGSLWDNKGNLLASVTFTNETPSGWQTASFDQPINIAANVMYVASYFAPNGHYSYDSGYFSGSSHSNGPLKAFSDTGSYGPNGVTVSTSSPAYPTQGHGGANYWVDVVFSTSLVAPPTAPAPPTTVNAAQSGSAINVSWNAGLSSNTITGYQVIRNGSTLTTVSGSTLNYNDTNVAAGQTYNYQIKTVDSTGTVSVASVTASVTYNVTPPVTCPAGTTGTPPNCVSSGGGSGSGSGGTGSGTGSGSGSGTGTGSWWQPTASSSISWNWVIGVTPSTPYKNVNMYDIDGFENTAATVSALHAQGSKVVCYIDVGTWETGRPDLSLIPTADKGAGVSGWPGEYWLNIADISGLTPMIKSRMQMCASKGFDAIEPDNLDGYTNTSGFPLTAADELAFTKFLASTAHSMGLSIGLKNDVDQASQLAPYFDWSLNEECNKYSECGTEAAFTAANKAVFNAEYIEDGETTAKFCAADAAAHINGVLYNLNLDGSTYQPCTQTW